ncbi:MAG: FkbM family methyltransferase [Candidatus Nitrotoga sp.]
MNKLRQLLKNYTKHMPWVYSVMQWIYHETRFILSSVLLKIKYPKLRIVRYSKDELQEQHRLGFRSQFGQDCFIHGHFFSDVAGGTFVDVGCNQPEFLNNTFFFERSRGWKGLAFDPMTKYQPEWAESRSAIFFPFALGGFEETKTFVEIENKGGWGNMMSAFAENVRPEDMALGYTVYAVSVRRASDVFEQHGVSSIDLMSIDVEGAEMDVLLGMEMPRYLPKVLLIENCRGLAGNEKIRQYLIARGYKFHARIWTADDVFCIPAGSL